VYITPGTVPNSPPERLQPTIVGESALADAENTKSKTKPTTLTTLKTLDTFMLPPLNWKEPLKTPPKERRSIYAQSATVEKEVTKRNKR
jgi:hypothetical protein